MPTWPAKTNYATGDVLTAAQMQDIGNALNSVQSAQYAAGKNAVINGDFRINQRAFTTTTTSGTFLFDRFQASNSGGTVTYTAQTFTAGTAPVAGYESRNFLDVATSGQSAASDFTRLLHKIESVRSFAGQTITISFWAKAATGTPSLAVELTQNFGSGGSPSSAVNTGTTKQAITTAWARYSFTITVPSISGKTIGTANDDFLQIAIFTSAGSNFNARTDTLGTQAATISFWGVQAESGSSATPFQTATGTLQGELAAAQRYYFRNTAGSAFGLMAVSGYNPSATAARMNFIFPVPMRIAPTSLDFSNIVYQDSGDTTYALTGVAIDSPLTTNFTASVNATIAGGTSNRSGRAIANNNAAAFVGFSAEL
jgi:hypothetical protein